MSQANSLLRFASALALTNGLTSKRAYYGGEWKPEYEQLIELPAGATTHPDYPRVAWCSALLYEKLGDYTKLGKRAHAAIPGSQLVELPAVGHLPQVEAFGAYSDALLTFLR